VADHRLLPVSWQNRNLSDKALLVLGVVDGAHRLELGSAAGARVMAVQPVLNAAGVKSVAARQLF